MTGNSILVAGPGDGSYPNIDDALRVILSYDSMPTVDPSTEGRQTDLRWTVGCGYVQAAHMDLLERIERTAVDGSMSADVGRPTLGWHVVNTRRRRSSGRPRRALHVRPTDVPYIVTAARPPQAADTSTTTAVPVWVRPGDDEDGGIGGGSTSLQPSVEVGGDGPTPSSDRTPAIPGEVDRGSSRGDRKKPPKRKKPDRVESGEEEGQAETDRPEEIEELPVEGAANGTQSLRRNETTTAVKPHRKRPAEKKQLVSASNSGSASTLSLSSVISFSLSSLAAAAVTTTLQSMSEDSLLSTSTTTPSTTSARKTNGRPEADGDFRSTSSDGGGPSQLSPLRPTLATVEAGRSKGGDESAPTTAVDEMQHTDEETASETVATSATRPTTTTTRDRWYDGAFDTESPLIFVDGEPEEDEFSGLDKQLIISPPMQCTRHACIQILGCRGVQ